ncbi:MAG: PEP-CTERM sorting domain-containing protein [Desulfobacteraceae bacterium]|nr:PEP-CTERM sorting domain-containing protein [Desulfobacteraceae bacterium]
MKKLFLSILSICMFLCLSGVGNATLIDQGDGTIYDNVSSMYWYQNLNDFKGKTYNQLLSSVSSLTTGGFSWHIATEDDMDSLLDNNVGEQDAYGNGSLTPEASQITDSFTSTATYGDTKIYFGMWESVPRPGYHNALEIQTRPTYGLQGAKVDNYYFIQTYDTYTDRYGSSDTGAWVTSGFIDNGPAPSVPEPATMMLFGLGLLGFAGVSRKKK